MGILNHGCIFLQDLLSLSFVDFLGEGLITCVTSLVILVLGKHFGGVLLIVANFFRSKYIKKTIIDGKFYKG